MFTSDVIITTRHGFSPTIASGNRSASLANLALTAQSPIAVNRGLELGSPATSDAMSRIFELVAAIEDQDRAPLAPDVEKNQRAGAEQIYREINNALMDADGVVEYLTSDERVAARRERGSMTERQEAFVAAARNGTLEYTDMEEFGLRSDVEYAVKFNSDGTYRGVAVQNGNHDRDAYHAWREENMIQNGDGTFTDRATGRNAAVLQKGHVFVYATWP